MSDALIRNAAASVSEARADVTCDLAYIRELSDAISESADINNPNRVEALARAIGLMTDNVIAGLNKHVDAAKGASHG